MLNQMKRLLALLLVAVMVMAFSGCGKQPGNENTGPVDVVNYPEYLNLESAIPIVKEGYEDVSLDVWVMRDGLASDLENSWSYKYLTEVLNVKLNITEFTSANRSTLLSTAFGANELPDVIIGGQGYLNANRLKIFGSVDKQLVDLAPYINETLMPNLTKIYAENPEYKSAVMDSDGHVWSFGLITYDDSGSVMLREYLNYEWLEELNLEEPETLEDLLDVLRAFKKDKPNSYPFGATNNSRSMVVLNALGYITSNNLGMDPALRNGKVVYPVSDREAYGEYVKFWKTCYEEELVDPDFFTLTSDEIGASLAKGNIGFSAAVYPYGYTDEYTDFWCMGPLTSEVNDVKQWPAAAGALTCGGFVVTTACENVALACRLADVLYTKHNYNLFNYGPNTEMEADYLMGWGGWSYGEAPEFEVIYHDMDSSYSNVNEFLWDTNRIWYAGTWGMHKYDGSEDSIGYYKTSNLSDPSTVKDTSEFRLELVNGKIPEGADHAIRSSEYELAPYVTRDVYPTTVYFDEDIALEIEDLKTVVNQYASAEFAKFVTGRRALTEDELTKYFDDIDRLGASRLVEIYTEYYNNVTKTNE